MICEGHLTLCFSRIYSFHNLQAEKKKVYIIMLLLAPWELQALEILAQGLELFVDVCMVGCLVPLLR